MAVVAEVSSLGPNTPMNTPPEQPDSGAKPETEVPMEPIVPPSTAEVLAREEAAQEDEPTPEQERRGAWKRKRIYFNPDKLPPSYPAYVAWLDVMGSRA